MHLGEMLVPVLASRETEGGREEAREGGRDEGMDEIATGVDMG